MMSSMCEGVDNAKNEEKPMKPELKFGRPVLAYHNRECDAVKAKYVCGCSDGHMILIRGAIAHRFHVKPDLDADPMNGDEVEFSDNDTLWCTGVYGHYNETNKKHYSMQGVPFDNVRFPQPSKRERVIEFLNSYYYPCNAEKIADQIDKIYTEES